MFMIRSIVSASLALVSGVVLAAPVVYNIDPTHTFPSFEADHMGGMSIWRGKFDKTSGTVQLDLAAKSGSIDITIDTSSIDFGMSKLSDHVKSDQMLDVAKFPTATYKGKLANFKGDVPTEVDGELTLHGVTKPVKLTINSFMCKVHPMLKKEFCGADASATINRADFGIGFGQQMGFKMDVKLAIQVEAVKAD
jgi:polyisoprenoid-binding protein YceI